MHDIYKRVAYVSPKYLGEKSLKLVIVINIFAWKSAVASADECYV